jgi:hypothetical protein
MEKKMGFDLYGVKPKIKEGSVQPTRPDWNTATETEKDEYYSALDSYEAENKGVYFRNNVWWWRPLAQYVIGHTKKYEEEYMAVYKKAELNNIKVQEELDEFQKAMDKKLGKDVAPANYPKEDYEKWNAIYAKMDNNGSYPFSESNVKEFAEFAEQSGGFTIC